jgi:hypothetical protein
MANEAVDEYKSAVVAGEDPAFPQWATDVLVVCDQAELGLALRQFSKDRSPVASAPPRRLI